MPEFEGHPEPSIGEKTAITEISSQGDVVLLVKHTGSTGLVHEYSLRVVSSALKVHSKYFERLFETGRFGEGEKIASRLSVLSKEYASVAKIPANELPVVNIEDLGRISAVKSIEPLLTDFFNILHAADTATSPPIGNLANLAIVADRFDALDPVKKYVRRKKILQSMEAKTLPKQEIALTEERIRQRLLVALLLDYSLWADRYGVRLIVKGWTGREADISDALWWDLPARVEEELAFRRDCVLETIQSLQDYFLALYSSSRTRQCRLGYDSSPECDSFQFGEMARFFLRSGTLKLQSSIVASEERPAPYDGDLTMLIEKLKQVPEYQVNPHHSHCGIRTRLVPLLDLVAAAVQHVGICGDCWSEDRRAYAWVGAKRPLMWKRSVAQLNLRSEDHKRRHVSVRDLLMAGERDWA